MISNLNAIKTDDKKPNVIDKEISGGVVKLFEVQISPHTLQSGVFRKEQDFNSNELRKSKIRTVVGPHHTVNSSSSFDLIAKQRTDLYYHSSR